METLPYIPFLPLLSALILLITAGRLSKLQVALLGVGSMAIAAILTFFVGIEFYSGNEAAVNVSLFTWLPIEGSPVAFAFHLDQLSMIMLGVVTGVGWMIHWYAAAYMFEDEHMQRFFVYMNLFVFAMLMLVLGDSLILLYLGWEGVGLCSFLLIGFWQTKPENVLAAKKAFIVTRIGDTALMLGLLLLFLQFDTLTIEDLLSTSTEQPPPPLLWLACLLLVGGAVGKSAQLPLQTWLPDAMAGPTPVSALIHAATMVTAGVYLIARLHPLFLQVEMVLTIIAWIGALTLVLAGLAALGQSDIKRVLAYSTMSQIGYMFLGLGAMAFNSAVFHLMTHAFFKALLFLTAGSIIVKMHHTQNMFEMGGLFKRLPVTSTFLLIGLLALVAFPGTSGFFSKEAILAASWHAETAGLPLWLMGVLGAFLTSLYSFRLLFIVCFGKPPAHGPESEFTFSSQFVVPLLPLVVLSVLGGLAGISTEQVFAETAHPDIPSLVLWLPVAVAAFGALCAWWWYFPRQRPDQPNSSVYRFSQSGLGFDGLYHALFVAPVQFIVRINKHDILDALIVAIAERNLGVHRLLITTQNGKVRWYLFATMAGTAILLGGLMIWL